MVDLADQHFNQAVAAAREKAWQTAAEHLTVTLALRPDDVEGLVLFGKVRYHQRRRKLAIELWRRALDLAPHLSDVQLAIDNTVTAKPASSRQSKTRRNRRRR